MRRVVDGERLSGRGNGSGAYPEIFIMTGQGTGGGELICSITGFHWVDVKLRKQDTLLDFEGKTRLSISDGIVGVRGCRRGLHRGRRHARASGADDDRTRNRGHEESRATETVVEAVHYRRQCPEQNKPVRLRAGKRFRCV